MFVYQRNRVPTPIYSTVVMQTLQSLNQSKVNKPTAAFLSHPPARIGLSTFSPLKIHFLKVDSTEGKDGNIDQLPLVRALTGDQTHNPGMCPN